jgi:DNA-3-methyladenine glycosylase II
LYTCEINKGL